MKTWMWCWLVVVVTSLVLLIETRSAPAEEVSFSKIFSVRNINVEYVAMRIRERAGALRASKHRDWLQSSCRNFGSALGNDFCWKAGKRTLHLALPEVGWAAYELVRPRVLWEFGQVEVRVPPGLVYNGGIKGGIALRQRGKEFSTALEIRF